MTEQRPRDWDEPVSIPDVDTVYATVLVPFDGSHAAELALGHARVVARFAGSEIVVLVAYDPPTTRRRRGSLTLDRLRSEMEEEADALASESVQLLVDEGISARGIVARGHVVDAILEAAETESVDLIVLGRRGLASEVKETEGYLPSGSGSVADRVALRAPCPVLVVG